MSRVPVEKLNVPLFWEKVVKTESCWNWAAYITIYGYGSVQIGKRPYMAHRVSFALANGPIPEGMIVDHICHNRACVNPKHLRIVTASQNSQNRRGATRINPTGVRGVELQPNGKYKTHAKLGGKRYTAGRFDTLEEASNAISALRMKVMSHTQN